MPPQNSTAPCPSRKPTELSAGADRCRRKTRRSRVCQGNRLNCQPMQPAWLGGTETDKRRKIFDKILQFSDFSILYACFGAVPCAYLPQGLITELDNGFQQNTRHTGRPSRHSRSIPMRRMFPNWAHRHRPPASHALTGGAPVADVLPEGKITTRRHLRSPLTACRASWKMFCRKGRLARGGTSAHRTQYAVPPWQMFCRKGRLPREAPPEASPAERHLDKDFGSGWESATGSHPRLPSVSRSRCFV